MYRDEALEKLAWHALKKVSRDEALDILEQFFKMPDLRDDLREKLNITVLAQWHTHQLPADLRPGNPIYRPVLIDHMKLQFKGYTNEYLQQLLQQELGLDVDGVEGALPDWLACPVCGYRTFPALGTWLTCSVCGWNSDPMQEALPDEVVGQNRVSLNQARQNFAESGLSDESLRDQLDPTAARRFPRG